MKTIKKTLLVLLVLLILVVAGAAIYVRTMLPNVGEPRDLKVEITPEKVEHGKYLAWHVFQCIDCHSQRDYTLYAGPPKPGTEAAGGERFDQSMGFPGVFYSRNITPSGIGDWTDGELFRLITTGVRKDGEPIFPVMPYHNYGKMANEDIEAVIAYLRTLEPKEGQFPESESDFPFNFLLRTMPAPAAPMKKPNPSDEIAYGEYMFVAASCGECHTKFEKGKFVGPLCGGGREFGFPDGSVLRAPNITSDMSGIGAWTEQMFIDKFKSYSPSSYTPPKVATGTMQTIMPWIMYADMEESDLAAIYKYLKTLPKVDNTVERFEPAKVK